MATSALIFAAGLGTRLRPFTFRKPKCMLEINGKSILEQNIERLQRLDFVVTVITGYCQYEIPRLKGVNYIYYPKFASTNSAATLKHVVNELKMGTLLMNADCLLLNDSFMDVLIPNATTIVCQELQTTGWAYSWDSNNCLTSVDFEAQTGYGDGIVFCDNLRDIIAIKEYTSRMSPQLFWENAIVDLHKTINIPVRVIQKFYEEYDSVQEYMNANKDEPETIAKQFFDGGKCRRLSGGSTNDVFLGEIAGEWKVVRVAGKNTEKIIDRGREQQIDILAQSVSVAPKSDFYHGIKISTFLTGYRVVEQITPEVIQMLYATLSRLHELGPNDCPEISQESLKSETLRYALASKRNDDRHAFAISIIGELDALPKVVCHKDLMKENMLTNGLSIKLIDFEYAGLAPIAWEWGFFVMLHELDDEKIQIISDLTRVNRELLYKGAIAASYFYFHWALVKELSDWTEFFDKQLNVFIKKLEELA